MVAGLALVGSVTVGMVTINMGFFIDPVSDELPIKQSFFGWAQTARFIGAALSGLVIGRIVDRYGARVPLALAGVLMAGAMVALARIGNGWHLLGVFVFMGMIGLGGPGGDIYIGVPVARWFVRKRGLAMSRVFLGMPLGILVMLPLTQFLIGHIGWRSALIVLGVSGGVVMALIGFFVVRRQPQDMGLLPDGDPPGGSAGAPTIANPGGAQPTRPVLEHSWTRAEAMRSPAFWKLSIAFGIQIFAFGAIGAFRIPYFVSRGVDPQTVSFAVSAEAISSFLVGFPLAMLLSRLQIRYIVGMGFMVVVAAFLMTITAAVAWQVFAATLLFGTGAQSLAILQSTLWPSYFGSAHLGSIRGAALAVMMVVGFSGGPIAGRVKDSFGSYVPVWWAAMGGVLLAAAMVALTPRPLAARDS